MNEVNSSAEPQVKLKKRPYSRLAIVSLFVGLASIVLMLCWHKTHPGTLKTWAIGSIVFGCVAGVRLHFVHRRGGGFIAAGIILCALSLFLSPLLRISRGWADLGKCGRNLYIIGQAIKAYQVAHEGMNPSDLQVLVDSGMVNESDLICPFPVKPQRSHTYIYRGGDLNANVSGSMILAYDHFDNHNVHGEPIDNVNVLTADSVVKYYGESNMWELIEQDNYQRRKLGLSEKSMEITPRLDREGNEIISPESKEPTP